MFNTVYLIYLNVYRAPKHRRLSLSGTFDVLRPMWRCLLGLQRERSAGDSLARHKPHPSWLKIQNLKEIAERGFDWTAENTRRRCWTANNNVCKPRPTLREPSVEPAESQEAKVCERARERGNVHWEEQQNPLKSLQRKWLSVLASRGRFGLALKTNTGTERAISRLSQQITAQ